MALEDTIIPQLLIKVFFFLFRETKKEFKHEIKEQQPRLQFGTCMQYAKNTVSSISNYQILAAVHACQCQPRARQKLQIATKTNNGVT